MHARTGWHDDRQSAVRHEAPSPAAAPSARRPRAAQLWQRLGPRFLPFADAASAELPLGRLLRLSLFQVSVGMAAALLVGTLNRVLIVEMGVAAWLVSAMVALPLLVAPFRAIVGFRSDTHASSLGWRRVPYLWFGSLMQFGGLAIMPFALLLLSGDRIHGPVWAGSVAAALAFLLAGAGLQTVQTAGLALANDLAPEESRPRVVALMYVMLLVGMLAGSVAFGALLRDFSPLRLIQVVQGAAMVGMALNIAALWKQEPRSTRRTGATAGPRPSFRAAWRTFAAEPRSLRFLVAVGLGTAAFNMQDIVLEPYGGAVLKLPVAATSMLTALLAGGALAAFAVAARRLSRGADPHRLAALGALLGVAAFSAVIFAAPLDSAALFRVGVVFIGFGGGLFAVSTLVSAMAMAGGSAGRSSAEHATRARLATVEHATRAGLVLGAWGAVQATAGGLAIGLGGALRDGVSALASQGLLGPALGDVAIGYSVVYHVEIALLFATLIAIGPLVRTVRTAPSPASHPFGLAQLPG